MATAVHLAMTRAHCRRIAKKFPLGWLGTELYLWTTFSEDQIDINFKNPQVLLESIDVILQHAASGAQSRSSRSPIRMG